MVRSTFEYSYEVDNRCSDHHLGWAVILQGRSSVVEEPNAFNGFTLTVEAVETSDAVLSMGPLAAGTFKLLPHEKNTKIDEICPNTIVHTSLTFVSNVEVLWTAPNPGIGCVQFR